MKKVEFSIEGVKGKFFCDADEMTSYKTLKQLSRAETDMPSLFDALERIFCGMDEEFVERVGGMEHLDKLMDAATEAVGAKKA